MLNYQRVKWGNKPWKIVSLCAFSFYVKIMGFSNASLQSETCQSSSKLWKISSCCVKSVHSEFGVWKCWNSKKLADRYKVPKDSGNILPSMSSLKGKSTPKCSMCFAICKPSFVSRQNQSNHIQSIYAQIPGRHPAGFAAKSPLIPSKCQDASCRSQCARRCGTSHTWRGRYPDDTLK